MEWLFLVALKSKPAESVLIICTTKWCKQPIAEQLNLDIGPVEPTSVMRLLACADALTSLQHVGAGRSRRRLNLRKYRPTQYAPRPPIQIPSAVHSLWVGLRAGAFIVRLASRAAQVRLWLLVRLHLTGRNGAAP